MPAAVVAYTAALACAWIPILLRFFRSWRARKNPISMAICVLIGFALYMPVYLATFLQPSWPLATVISVDTIACVTFFGAFWYSRGKFFSTRSRDLKPELQPGDS